MRAEKLKVGRRRAGEEGIGGGGIESTGLAQCTSKRCGHARWSLGGRSRVVPFIL